MRSAVEVAEALGVRWPVGTASLHLVKPRGQDMAA